MTILIPNQRHLFDIPDDVAYLNCATMGPLPDLAVQAGIEGLARKARPWSIPSEDFFKDTERLRPKLARLIHARSDDIALVPSVSYAMATAAQNIALQTGQSILAMADQFPSNVYVWRELAERTGANMKMVGATPEKPSLSDALLEAIGPETGLVCCAQVRWTDGAKLNLEAIGARCRDVGAALVLDLTQSCAAMVFDVRAVQPDFMVAAGYKWMFGPYSTAFMYVAPHRQAGRPLEHNWITHEGSRDFTALTDYRDTFEPGAQRFDMGERSNFALLPALEASVDMLLDWGVANIEATLGTQTRALAQRLNAIGLTCPEEHERGSHYLGARLPERAPGDLTARLQAERIHVSRRGQSLRITPHVYNTPSDLDRLIDALGRHLSR